MQQRRKVDIMKLRRLLPILLVVMLINTLTVIADDFVLRNDIQFGDSVSEVQKKETLTTKRDTNDDGETELETPEGGTIAGIDDSKVTFTFNKDDELYDMRYYFYEDAYDTLSDALIDKYGDPLEPDGDVIFVTRTSALTAAARLNSMYEMLGDKMEVLGFSQWLVECDDYSVKIDLIEMNFYNSSKPHDYYTLIGYRKVTDEEVQNDINDDL